MKIENLDVGVKHALRAYYVERGLSENIADDKVRIHLEASCKLVRSKIGSVLNVPANQAEIREWMEDVSTRFNTAFNDLKVASQGH
jgi:hypothetical protein